MCIRDSSDSYHPCFSQRYRDYGISQVIGEHVSKTGLDL